MAIHPPEAVQKAQRKVADDTLRRCSEVEITDLPVGYSLSSPTATIPSLMIRWTILSVLFQLNSARKWHAALERQRIPDALLDWLGARSLDALADGCRLDWVDRKLFVKTLSDEVGRLLIELAQPRSSASIRQAIRQLFLSKAHVDEKGGVVLQSGFWSCILRQAKKPLSSKLQKESLDRIDFALGQFELAEAAPRRYLPLPVLEEKEREALEAAVVEAPSERQQALDEAFECGLFDFIPDLFATTYSLHGRRAHHPLVCFKVFLAMMVMGESNPQEFYRRVNDSLQLRLFLNVFRAGQLPTPRRIKAFVEEKLAPAAEFIVLWLNLNILEDGGVEIGDAFGTDGMEMNAKARMKSDAAGLHLAPFLSWMLLRLRTFLDKQGRADLTESEREQLLDAIRSIGWSDLGNAKRSKSAILDAVRDALEARFVTPARPRPPPAKKEKKKKSRKKSKEQGARQPTEAAKEESIPGTFQEFIAQLAAAFRAELESFGPKFGWSTQFDPQCGARSKHGKTVYGYGLQFLVDLTYGFVWAYEVLPAGESFQPRIAQYIVHFKETYELDSLELTSDREFTIGKALNVWHQQRIDHYGPRSTNPSEKLGIFTEKDFEIHDEYVVCPAGQRLPVYRRNVQRSVGNEQKRYRGKQSVCGACEKRTKCTTGKGPKILCVHRYRDDINKQAERMEADPEKTRDLMGKHRAITEGAVNNLKTHQGARNAAWKGLAMARAQFGTAIILANTLKWRKVKRGALKPVQLKPLEPQKTPDTSEAAAG